MVAHPGLSAVLRSTGGRSVLADDKLIDSEGADVSGVGDAAYGVSDRGQATVSFSKGDAYASILVSNIQIGASPQEDQAIALAKLAANRI